jgi:tetratricopeptide (TPR) repeat protein
VAAQSLLELSSAHVVTGKLDTVRAEVQRALRIDSTLDVQLTAALVVSRVDPALAMSIADQIEQRAPPGTVMRRLIVPLIRGAADVARGRSEAAIERFDTMRAYDQRYPNITYLRGLALLAGNRPADAEREFTGVLERRNLFGAMWPAAHYQRALARQATGDTAGMRADLETMLAAVPNADADLPILQDARRRLAATSTN